MKWHRHATPQSGRERKQAFLARRETKLAEIAGRPRADACELCGDEGKTVFDHCHERGHFRGWLCNRCNVTLGLARDSIELLRRMIAYLEKDHGKTQHSKT